MTDEGNLTFSALEMPEIDKQKRPHFALSCHLTPSTCTNVAKSAFTCQVQSFCFYC